MAKAKTSATSPALPDVAAMEAYASTASPQDRELALSKAQNMMYEVWSRKTERARKAMAMKALGVCPLCADAFNLLAMLATDPKDTLDLYRLGVKGGELALGPEGFRDYDGEFWGFLETRPYMRARHGLALALLDHGDEDAAIAHFRAMLELNPGDNQGIRYLLLARLMQRDDIKAVKHLLKSYAEEWSIHWLYTEALVAFREGRGTSKATLKRLKDAYEANAHVPAILAGTEAAAPSSSGLVSFGSPEEATDYLEDFGAAWRKTEGAVEWLAAARD